MSYAYTIGYITFHWSLVDLPGATTLTKTDKGPGTIKEWGTDDSKNQRISDSSVKLCLLVTSEVMSMATQMWAQKEEWHQQTYSKKWTEKARVSGNWVKLRAEKEVLPRKKAQKLVAYCQTVGPGNIHTNNIMWIEKLIYKINYDWWFEGEQEGLWGS